MPKFNLLIADIDERYANSLGRYIRNTHPEKFAVNVFTQREAFREFLEIDTDKLDILLISCEFLPDIIGIKARGASIVLTDGKYAPDTGGLPTINKYQTGEKILNDIVDLYTNLYPVSSQSSAIRKKADVLSIISPQGGSGKTTIAASLACQFAVMNLKVLYLNLETFNSSKLIFDWQEPAYGLSNLFFYLKEKKQNLRIKLDMMKTYDSRLNVYYFKEMDCSLELEELTEADMLMFINELRSVGYFDMIVIDTDSTLNRRNIAVLESSDVVLVVTAINETAGLKLDRLSKDIQKVMTDDCQSFFDKSELIINKYIPDSGRLDIFFSSKEVYGRIPCLDDLYVLHGAKLIFNANGSISKHIKIISEGILSKIHKSA